MRWICSGTRKTKVVPSSIDWWPVFKDELWLRCVLCSKDILPHLAPSRFWQRWTLMEDNICLGLWGRYEPGFHAEHNFFLEHMDFDWNTWAQESPQVMYFLLFTMCYDMRYWGIVWFAMVLSAVVTSREVSKTSQNQHSWYCSRNWRGIAWLDPWR